MRYTLLVFVILLLSGCLATQRAREYIDSSTASTVTVANQGWVFARERSDLAIHAQDYITITPVQLNRGGQRVVYLYCQLWSTIDRRGDKTVVPTDAKLTLIGDDRTAELPDSATDIRRLGFGQAPVPSPNNSTEVRVAAINIELLRSLATATQLRVALNAQGVTYYFDSWRNGKSAMQDFLRHVGNE